MTDNEKMRDCPTDGMTEAEKKAFIRGFEMCEQSIWWGPMTNNWPYRVEHGCTLPPAVVAERKRRVAERPALLMLGEGCDPVN